MNTRRTAALLLSAALTVAAATTASASTLADGGDSHCVAETGPIDAEGRLDVLSLSCFDDFDEVLAVLVAPEEMIDRVDHPSELTDDDMAVLGPPEHDTAGERSAADETATAASTFTLAIHYDGPSFSGPSFTVTGSDCAGGYLNMSSTWNNRITSTRNGCPTVVHYDGYNLVGTSQTTTGSGGTLTYMDNRTSSAQYRT